MHTRVRSEVTDLIVWMSGKQTRQLCLFHIPVFDRELYFGHCLRPFFLTSFIHKYSAIQPDSVALRPLFIIQQISIGVKEICFGKNHNISPKFQREIH